MTSISTRLLIAMSVAWVMLGAERSWAQTAGTSCATMTEGACACSATGCFVCRAGSWATQEGGQVCASGPRAPQASYYVVPQPYFMTAPSSSPMQGVNNLDCNASSAGIVRYKDNKLEQCNGTDWTQISTGSGATAGSCLATFARLASYRTPSSAGLVRGQGSLIYTVTQNGAILALTFNGTAFTLRGSRDATNAPRGLYATSTNVFLTSGANLSAMRFDETTNTFVSMAGYSTGPIPAGSTSDPVLTDVASDGRYFYVLYPPSNVLALSFNGMNFTFLKAYTHPSFSGATSTGGEVLTMTAAAANAGYGPARVVMLGTKTGITALSFDGTNFTEIHSTRYGIQDAARLASDGTYIYAWSRPTPPSTRGALWVYSFDGTRLLPRVSGSLPIYSLLWADRTGIFVTLEANVVQSMTFDGEAFSFGPKFLERLGEDGGVDGFWSDGRFVYYLDREYGLAAMRRGCVRFF